MSDVADATGEFTIDELARRTGMTVRNIRAHQTRGLLEQCPECGSTDVVGETRVVGYFSKIQNWNKSKRYGELLARHAGRYNITTADAEPTLATAEA